MARGQKGNKSPSKSPTGTQSLSPGTTQCSQLSFMTTPGNNQTTVQIPSNKTPTPNAGGQVPSQLTQATDNITSNENSGLGKLIWSSVMEKSALDLYVKVVIDVRSKYNQTFRKWYGAFVACKGASGFGWNNEKCMVTASDDVWNSFLVLHPLAKRFKNTPFPEYNNLHIIFTGQAATGALHRGAHGNGEDNNNHQDLKQDGPNAPERASGGEESPTGLASQRLGSSIKQLITAFSDTVPEPSAAQDSKIDQALAKFQDNFADNLTMEELLAGFVVLENEAKAHIFLVICDPDHSRAWFH
ncbi:uncharacterized protein PGTG_10005 [Puccinia graminis f. sp. tritici CRL 75-36-700-3]|uniref:Uncharacterized protein n=1 Tax=Puccinia graminis f. sp. tritici (strain CRL 75-36-700-3 / race SCCL) TaxID=418459 RepID=E3KF05_PUCGT|nr:uncharacterized protein PGTG_10005 [Puccinia graminis f. sp. tritici CRL 75-36-700-3]EFP83037.2 hypothetical protein PGTG_10005 [Puccinia graminis f. sp. tritici CRL 75-36-700-3]